MVTKRNKPEREAGRAHARRIQALPIIGDITQETQPGPLPEDQIDPLTALEHENDGTWRRTEPGEYDALREGAAEHADNILEATGNDVGTQELEARELDEVMGPEFGEAAEAQHSADESWALQEGGLPEVQPEPVPPPAPISPAPQKKEYQARRFVPDTVIALGPEAGKPGTVAHWLRGVLLEVLDAKRKDGDRLSDQTCTVGEWTAEVIKQQASCPSKCKPVRDNIWGPFVTGYLRWQVNHGQIRLVPQK